MTILFTVRDRLPYLLPVALLFLLVLACGEAAAEEPKKEPSKQALLETLQQFHQALERKDYQEAAKLIATPPNFRPEQLKVLLDRREISAAGIRVLKVDGKFGKATEVFKKDRATYFAEKAKVNVDQCYGFNHEQDGTAGEVVGVWDGKAFQLIRIDDVGKLVEKPAAKKPLAKTDILKMLPELEAAVKADPRSVAAKARYAQALYRVGNLPAAWKQLRAANKLDPKHKGVAAGYEQVFRGFERMGVFTVGAPSATIKSLLGDPDKVVTMSWGKRWVYFFLTVELVDDRVHETVDLRGATKDWFVPTETVKVDLDGRGWRCNLRRKTRGLITALYLPAGQTMTEWTEQFEIERIVGGAKAGEPAELGAILVRQITKRIPNAKAKVLNSDESSVFVAIFTPAPEGKPKHQLVRLIRADNDVHRIAYAIKTETLDAATQKKWYAILKKATLQPVSPQP